MLLQGSFYCEGLMSTILFHRAWDLQTHVESFLDSTLAPCALALALPSSCFIDMLRTSCEPYFRDLGHVCPDSVLLHA